MLGKFITSILALLILGTAISPAVAITGSSNTNKNDDLMSTFNEDEKVEKEFEFEGRKYRKEIHIIYENGVMRKKVKIEGPNGKYEYKIVKTVDDVMPEEDLDEDDFDDGVVVDNTSRCAAFEDIQKNDKLCKYLHKAKIKSVVSPNARFFGNAPVSRAQFAAMVVRAFGLEDDLTDVDPFADVDSTNTFYKPIMVLKALGIVSGAEVDEGIFRFFPRKPITRGEAIKILVNTLEASDKFEFESYEFFVLGNKFKDQELERDRFVDYIKKLYASEAKMPEVLVKGYSDGYLRTGRFISRIEAIVMITRAMWAAGLVDEIGEVDPGAGTGSMMDDEDDDSDDQDDDEDDDIADDDEDGSDDDNT